MRPGFWLRGSLGGFVRSHHSGSTLARKGAIATLALTALAFQAGDSHAQCLLVRERGGAEYAPHFAMHFGDPSEVPRSIQCSTSLDKDLPIFSIPIYAYNLWEGAVEFELTLRTPTTPLGFDRGPVITGVEMSVATDAQGAITSLHLSADDPVCGPALLGRLRLASAELPENFQIQFAGHQDSGRSAARAANGQWRNATVDADGAHVAPHAACPGDPCGSNTPVLDLRATPGERTGLVDLAWTSGSGNLTLLRYRNDGRYPSDPWDGELLAFLPATVTHFTQEFAVPGRVRIAAWSITRGPYANLYAASNIECGSLASVLVQLPVGVAPRAWGQVKTLYR